MKCTKSRIAHNRPTTTPTGQLEGPGGPDVVTTCIIYAAIGCTIIDNIDNNKESNQYTYYSEVQYGK